MTTDKQADRHMQMKALFFCAGTVSYQRSTLAFSIHDASQQSTSIHGHCLQDLMVQNNSSCGISELIEQPYQLS